MIGLDAVPRPLEPGDRERLVRMFDRLSRQTVQMRFFSPVRFDAHLLDTLTAVDHERHEALVVPVGDEIVALASYHRLDGNPSVADVAVLVEDGWQHYGLGRRLMRHLARLAAVRGVAAFHADVLAENGPAVGLVRRMDRAARARFEDGGLAFDFPLTPAA